MTATMRDSAQTLYASFADVTLAEKAAGALLDHGVRAEDISLIAKEYDTSDTSDRLVTNPNRESAMDFVPEDNLDNRWDTPAEAHAVTHDAHYSNEAERVAKNGITTTTPGDAAAGAAKGAGIGLGVGALAAIASLTIPGVGIVAGGGALATAIAGAAGATAAGALAGGVHGYIKDQGIPDEAAAHYSDDYHRGGAILAVTVPSNGVDVATAERILWKYQGSHVSSFGDYTN